MFKFNKVFIALALLVCSAGVVWGQSDTSKKKVAVYVTGDTDNSNKKIIGAKLVQAIIKNGNYTAVERTEAIMQQLRKEQSYQRTGNVDDNQIGRLGKELGVNYVCVAEVVEAFGSKYISARLVDVELMEAIKFADVNGDIDDMPSLVLISEKVATKLLGSGSNSQSTNTSDVNSSIYCKGVLINGVRWATHNVGEKGKFVSEHSNYNSGYYTWTEAQNVCPTGWRLPTWTELKYLKDAGSTAKEINGVFGRLFGSGTNSIFMPAAGFVGGSSGLSSMNDVAGHYWSSTEDNEDNTYAFFLDFISGAVMSGPINEEAHKSMGMTVRCVCEK